MVNRATVVARRHTAGRRHLTQLSDDIGAGTNVEATINSLGRVMDDVDKVLLENEKLMIEWQRQLRLVRELPLPERLAAMEILEAAAIQNTKRLLAISPPCPFDSPETGGG